MNADDPNSASEQKNNVTQKEDLEDFMNDLEDFWDLDKHCTEETSSEESENSDIDWDSIFWNLDKHCTEETSSEESENSDIDQDSIETEFRYSIIDSEIRIDKYNGLGETVNIPEQIEGLPVTSIGDHAFSFCESLTGIALPASITSIGNSAFSFCENLTWIYIPDSVTSIGVYAFSFCENLTWIYIPDSVTSIGYGVFSGCKKLETIYINASTLSREEVKSSIDEILKENPSCKILPIPRQK